MTQGPDWRSRRGRPPPYPRGKHRPEIDNDIRPGLSKPLLVILTIMVILLIIVGVIVYTALK